MCALFRNLWKGTLHEPSSITNIWEIEASVVISLTCALVKSMQNNSIYVI